MGNKSSTGSEPSLSSYSATRDDLFASSLGGGNRNLTGGIGQSPSFPKRAYTISERQIRPPDSYGSDTMQILRSGSDAAVMRSPRHAGPLLPPSQLSAESGANSTTDDLQKHIVETVPENGSEKISLGAQISVTFDKDVKSVIGNKLFEVTCTSIDPSLNPIKGHVSYDSRLMKAEFTPSNTFLPNAQYTVVLKGRAVTTTLCSHGSNIKDAELSFKTCDPSPKSIGVKLKGDVDSEHLKIGSYYDLYNSLILWCTKKWGCSGEHITCMYIEKEGKTLNIKSDLDVLNVNENETIIVEIKD